MPLSINYGTQAIFAKIYTGKSFFQDIFNLILSQNSLLSKHL